MDDQADGELRDDDQADGEPRDGELLVEHHRVAAYREALGPTLGTCDGSLCPPSAEAVPLTYYMATGWPALVDAGSRHLEAAGAAGAPLTLVRYSLEADRPLAIGDRVRTDVVVGSRSRAPGGSFLSFAHDTRLCSAEHAVPLARQTSTVLVQGLHTEARDRELLRRDSRGRIGEPTRHAMQLSDDVAEAFARASGDLNPIHIDGDAARSAGFDGVVVHGMCLLALALECIPTRAAARPFSLSCQFGSPAHPGEELTVSVWLAESPGALQRFAFNAATRRSAALKNGLVTFARPPQAQVV